MRPTFMGFETAKRGLSVNQKSLDIVGNNVSNIGVTGYTRQRADLVSLSVNQRYSRYNNSMVSTAGQGANVLGISQVRDKFLDKRFREEYSDVGYYNVTSAVLNDITASLDEISPSTMSTAMTRFRETWAAMQSQSMNETTGAANLRANATQIVQIFQQMSAKLDNVWEQQEYSLGLDVQNVNSILQRVALLNDEIRRSQLQNKELDGSRYQPLELIDQRNVLLDQLAEYSDIYYETGEDGQVTVWMGAKSEDNPPVVSGLDYEQMSMQTNDNGNGFKTVSLYWNHTGKEVPFNTGALRGALDMLNGRGLDATATDGEVFTQGILYYKDKIDEFARTFVEGFNTLIEEVNEDGSPYDPPQFKSLFNFSMDEFSGAGNIVISEEWEKDPSYIITNILDKMDGDKDNSYAAKAENLFNKVLDFGEFQGTFDEYIRFYSTTKLANDKNYSDSRLEAVSEISDTILNQIQSVSGVSMEEEGVELMMYKKAYDAVSRVFTTLDEMLDKLINGTGRVGL